MLIPRSIACAAMTVATAVAVALPAQAGSAATATAPAAASAATERPQVRTASPVQAARTNTVDDSSGDDSADDSSDDVQVVDGTDAPEDDSDVLADDSGSSSSSGSAARRDKTSGRWAQIARPSAVRARLTSASRALVTWRSSVGGVLAQRFVVELRAGGSVLRTTTFSSARSAAFWSLSPAKRYSVTVTAVAADGTRRLASGASIRTPAAAAKPVKRSAASAKAAARHAKAVSLG